MSTTGYRSTSPLHGLLSGLLSAAIVCSTLIPCAQARAADGSVLDLEGDDKAKVAALSKALRGQFAARGIGGGKEMSAIEFKLTMGCDDPPEPRCMANGGKSLGVGQLVYGSLKGKGPSYQVELVLVDVGSGSVTKSHNATIEASGLEAGAIEATAKGLVEAMIGAPPPDPEPEVAPPVEAVEAPEDAPRSRLVWGRHKAATWKKAGFATSLVLTGLSAGAGVALGLMSSRDRSAYNDVIDAAKASLDDDDPDNNVNPFVDPSVDLCGVAREVGNAEVTKACDKGDGLARGATISFIGAGVFAASTLAFAVLLFVHREDSTMARLRERNLTLGVAPMRGGVAFGGGWRF
ncbi:MAG: hypothetical protein IPK80_26290 [Nannocystis sp.]|nr:hypothetical protein [Nannocystis sp.]